MPQWEWRRRQWFPRFTTFCFVRRGDCKLMVSAQTQGGDLSHATGQRSHPGKG
jgi:hypothetical protein